MNFSKSDIQGAFARFGPMIEAHQEVMSYERPAVEDIIASKDGVKQSAVVALIYPKASGWHILLLKRHDYKGVHSGQVGLPGGRMEPGESKADAALRELFEETGYALDRAELMDGLSALYIPPSNFVVYPFAAVIEEEPNWDFDTYEVKRGMEIPLSRLLDGQSLRPNTVKMSGSEMQIKVKAFELDSEVVWGATAMILNECKRILLNLAP